MQFEPRIRNCADRCQIASRSTSSGYAPSPGSFVPCWDVNYVQAGVAASIRATGVSRAAVARREIVRYRAHPNLLAQNRPQNRCAATGSCGVRWHEATTASPILNYDMHQKWGAVASFNPTDYGRPRRSGKMLIKLEGRLLPGTYLRVGFEHHSTRRRRVPSDSKPRASVANIADLATLETFIISRDGTEISAQESSRVR